MEWACLCRKSKSVGPFVYDRGVRCEIEDDGSIFDATGRRRFPIYISRQSYGMIFVETETAMRYIQAHRAIYGRCNCKRTVRIHSCKCECRCNEHFRRKNKQKCYELKSVDQATQIENSTTTVDIAVQVNTTQKTKKTCDQQASIESEKELSHELTIPDTSVSALRCFLSFNADKQILTKFDSDEQFRLKMLYKLQPLVHVERSPQVKELMLKRFAEGLGLKHVADVQQDSMDSNSRATPLSSRNSRRNVPSSSSSPSSTSASSSSSTSSSNSTSSSSSSTSSSSSSSNSTSSTSSSTSSSSSSTSSSSSSSSSRQHRDKDSSDDFEAPSKRKQLPSSKRRTKRRDVVKPKVFRLDKKTRKDDHRKGDKENNSAKKQNSREYTPLEDAAIVRWICVGGASRERKVKGNQIWKQLQEEYSVLSGQERSWHSLRNRYLRHILPSLQRRGDVATAVATRLRAHAAMGQAKPAPDPAKESVRTVSAWSLRPRTPRLSHTPNDPRDPLNPLNPPSRRRPLFNPRSVGD